jgi:hypothetical protein
MGRVIIEVDEKKHKKSVKGETKYEIFIEKKSKIIGSTTFSFNIATLMDAVKSVSGNDILRFEYISKRVK